MLYKYTCYTHAENVTFSIFSVSHIWFLIHLLFTIQNPQLVTSYRNHNQKWIQKRGFPVWGRCSIKRVFYSRHTWCSERKISRKKEKTWRWNNGNTDFEILCTGRMCGGIFVVKSTFTNRKRKFLAPGCTSELSNLLWKEKKSVCVWSWKRANIRTADIICSGVCTDCKAKIQCEATSKCLRFIIENFNPDFVHKPNKKRRVLNVDMSKLQAKLDGKSVQRVRAEMANDLMSFDDPDPPVLPNAGALRKVKSRIDCSDTDPFTAMAFLQKKYPKTIHSIGYDPFFVIYSIPFQQALYRGEVMRTKSITTSIDSTGLVNFICSAIIFGWMVFFSSHIFIMNFVSPYSGLRKPLKDSLTDTYILFYCIVCHSAKKSFPVGFMLSQVHTMEWLIHWLQTWKPSKKKLIPLEIIMDESSALIGAAVIVFTQDKNTFQYIDRCMNVKMKKVLICRTVIFALTGQTWMWNLYIATCGKAMLRQRNYYAAFLDTLFHVQIWGYSSK